MTDTFKIILFSISFLFTWSEAMAQDLQEKMFEFKSVEDTSYVKAELFLLEQNQFCIIRYTKKANKVTGGTYKLANDSLYLTFVPKLVTLGVHGRFRFYLRERRLDLPIVGFQVAMSNPEQLKGKLYQETLPFAIRTIDRSEEQDRITSLLDSPEWKVLEGRKIKDVKKESKDENQRAK
ncbi:hypothetical protein ACFSJU_08700 [Paradesertivirga mongoliensis]|uniref:DUF4468 domain-containing protein n=1 Tax=Paradesertivirga mongoliensis TaxID=2100740 RepID=A0ABW4ZL30_9SPHI|nr:hypothetical protein [Pedobacter mongoliensis]